SRVNRDVVQAASRTGIQIELIGAIEGISRKQTPGGQQCPIQPQKPSIAPTDVPDHPHATRDVNRAPSRASPGNIARAVAAPTALVSGVRHDVADLHIQARVRLGAEPNRQGSSISSCPSRLSTEIE